MVILCNPMMRWMSQKSRARVRSECEGMMAAYCDNCWQMARTFSKTIISGVYTVHIDHITIHFNGLAAALSYLFKLAEFNLKLSGVARTQSDGARYSTAHLWVAHQTHAVPSP